MSVDALTRPCAPQDARHAENATNGVVSSVPCVTYVTPLTSAAPWETVRSLMGNVDPVQVRRAHSAVGHTSGDSVSNAVQAGERSTQRAGEAKVSFQAWSQVSAVSVRVLTDMHANGLNAAGAVLRVLRAPKWPQPTTDPIDVHDLEDHPAVQRQATRASRWDYGIGPVDLVDICFDDAAFAVHHHRVVAPGAPTELTAVNLITVQRAACQAEDTLASSSRPCSNAMGAM